CGVNLQHTNSSLEESSSPRNSWCLANQLFRPLQRGANLGRLFAAGLREIRTAPTSAADNGSNLLDDVAGMVAFCEFFAYRRKQAYGCCPRTCQHHHAGADFFFELIGDVAEL